MPIFIAERGRCTLAGCANLEVTLLAIVPQHAGAEQFGQLTCGKTAAGVHLPEAILCRDVCLREQQIIQRLRPDMRHSEFVPNHGYPSRNSVKRDRPIDLRQFAAFGGVDPQCGPAN
jgi:hypothetical protein